MKLLFSGISSNLLRYLLPRFIADKDRVYITDNLNFTKIINREQFDYIIIDIDNLEFDIFTYVENKSIKAKWIFYSYQYDEKYIDILRSKGILCSLSKNIHPEYLYFKIRSVIDKEEPDAIVYKRKFFRAEVENFENVRATLYLPTIKNPIFARIKQISIIGMHLILPDLGDYVLIKENTFLSSIFLRLNGYRFEVSGRVIKKNSINGVIILFEKLDNFAMRQISNYIYKKMEKYLKSLKDSMKNIEEAESKNSFTEALAVN